MLRAISVFDSAMNFINVNCARTLDRLKPRPIVNGVNTQTTRPTKVQHWFFVIIYILLITKSTDTTKKKGQCVDATASCTGDNSIVVAHETGINNLLCQCAKFDCFFFLSGQCPTPAPTPMPVGGCTSVRRKC
jgi:hypothetical protein